VHLFDGADGLVPDLSLMSRPGYPAGLAFLPLRADGRPVHQRIIRVPELEQELRGWCIVFRSPYRFGSVR